MSQRGIVRSVTAVAEADRRGAQGTQGWIYRRLGVEPLINCAGVRTNYGGSNPSDDVLAAMTAAADAFVDLDELAEAIGRRIAALTGAWGIVTAGTAAGLTLATAACVAGNDPELMVRLPNTWGMRRRVVMPAGQRFDYDHAIRMVGAEIVTVADEQQLIAALDSETTGMVCVLARSDAGGGLSLRRIAELARRRKIPVLVDAAGLVPAKPDPWLAKGADLVVYSGGKYLRGPQSTGFLVGNEGLCRAAWLNGPPHQAFGRALKIGKEEMVGALVALEGCFGCGIADERARWRGRLNVIRAAVECLRGVSVESLSSASVTAERMRIRWDRREIPLDAETLRQHLLAQRPRVLLHDFWSTPDSIVVDPVNLTDAQAPIAAMAIAAALSGISTRGIHGPADAPPAIDPSGRWTVSIAFQHAQAQHIFDLRADARGNVVGHHEGRRGSGTVTGRVQGNRIDLVARHAMEPMPLYYTFAGAMRDGAMTGDALLGAAADEHCGPVFKSQFGSASWTARRLL
jgi:seryl-tRNA(Sec) selenium transferase